MINEGETSRTICSEVADRLLDGGDLEGNARLLSHAGSCLSCFRLVGDLRDLPRIENLMRAAAEDVDADPGEAFWAKFPDAVTAAWVADGAPRSTTAIAPSTSFRDRLVAWLRLPVPAALAGAALSGLLVFAFFGSTAKSPERDPPAAAVASVAKGDEADESGEVHEVDESGEAHEERESADLEQSLASLDDSELETLVMEIEAEEIAPVAENAADEYSDDSTSSLAEEMEGLETAELKALVTALRKQSHI